MVKTVSILLALLILGSNIGFSINTHLCDGEAIETSISIGIHNPDCGMVNTVEGCAAMTPEEEQLKSNPCCENQHQVIQLVENATIQSSTISVNPVFLIAFVHAIIEPIIFANQSFVQSIDSLLPLPFKDFQVLFQNFLI